jgi:hypothetical protein
MKQKDAKKERTQKDRVIRTEVPHPEGWRIFETSTEESGNNRD